MRSAWPGKSLGEVCEFQRGLTYAKGDEVDSSDSVVLRATNIDLATNLLDLSELRYISDRFEVPASKKVKKGSLLVCTASGSKSHLGKIAYIDEDYQYAFGGFMGMITPNKEIAPRFLFHMLTSGAYKDFIAGLSDGANINNLKFDDLKRFEVPCPPLMEQQRIVAILDEAFAAIATAKANTEKNLTNARALFESHLQAVCDERREGWVETTLGAVCDLFQGLAINAKSKHLLVPHSSLPLLRIKDLRAGTAEQFVAETGYPPNARVCESDIVYTRTGQIGLVFRGRTGVLHNNCFKVSPRSNLSPDFLFWWLQNPSFRARITALASRMAQPDIPHSLFKAESICIPPLSFQSHAASTLNLLSAECDHLESVCQQKLAALDALKKSLLHQAFAGQLTPMTETQHV